MEIPHMEICQWDVIHQKMKEKMTKNQFKLYNKIKRSHSANKLTRSTTQDSQKQNQKLAKTTKQINQFLLIKQNRKKNKKALILQQSRNQNFSKRSHSIENAKKLQKSLKISRFNIEGQNSCIKEQLSENQQLGRKFSQDKSINYRTFSTLRTYNLVHRPFLRLNQQSISSNLLNQTINNKKNITSKRVLKENSSKESHLSKSLNVSKIIYQKRESSRNPSKLKQQSDKNKIQDNSSIVHQHKRQVRLNCKESQKNICQESQTKQFKPYKQEQLTRVKQSLKKSFNPLNKTGNNKKTLLKL